MEDRVQNLLSKITFLFHFFLIFTTARQSIFPLSLAEIWEEWILDGTKRAGIHPEGNKWGKMAFPQEGKGKSLLGTQPDSWQRGVACRVSIKLGINIFGPLAFFLCVVAFQISHILLKLFLLTFWTYYELHIVRGYEFFLLLINQYQSKFLP